MTIFLRLGFLIHSDKSTFLTSQEITYLGFIFRSTNILLSATEDKKEKIKEAYISYLGKESLKTMELSS